MRAKDISWASDDSIYSHINSGVEEEYYEIPPKKKFRISDERIYTHIHLNHTKPLATETK